MTNRGRMVRASILVFSPSIYLVGCITQVKPILLTGLILTVGVVLFLLFEQARDKR